MGMFNINFFSCFVFMIIIHLLEWDMLKKKLLQQQMYYFRKNMSILYITEQKFWSKINHCQHCFLLSVC